MSLLIGPMQMKILGHKKLTLHKEVEHINGLERNLYTFSFRAWSY